MLVPALLYIPFFLEDWYQHILPPLIWYPFLLLYLPHKVLQLIHFLRGPPLLHRNFIWYSRLLPFSYVLSPPPLSPQLPQDLVMAFHCHDDPRSSADSQNTPSIWLVSFSHHSAPRLSNPSSAPYDVCPLMFLLFTILYIFILTRYFQLFI